MKPLDPRLNAIRPDLADLRLKGRVEAAAWAEPAPGWVRAGTLNVHKRPDGALPLETQLTLGESVRVFERGEVWSWVQSDTDSYVGYVATPGLSSGIGSRPTHRIAARSTHLFRHPTLKSPPSEPVGYGAQVSVSDERDGYGEVTGLGLFLPLKHLAALDAMAPNPIAEAERLLGAPYLWGGRSGLGLDCSALVQLTLAACGIGCPRDTDLQREHGPGTRLPPDAPLRRGDLVFFPGHVGFALGDGRLLHANAHHLSTTIDPVDEVAARAGGILAVRRL